MFKFFNWPVSKAVCLIGCFIFLKLELRFSGVILTCNFNSYFRLSPDNVLGIRRFSENLNCISVVEEADKYIQKNFAIVAQTEEFHLLDFVDLESILERDNLHVDSEEQVRQELVEFE